MKKLSPLNLSWVVSLLFCLLFSNDWTYAKESPSLIEENLQPQLEVKITIQGRLFEKGTKVPLKDVQIYVLPHKIKTQSQSDGTFRVEVPEGNFEWVINLAGYNRLDEADFQDSKQSNKVRELFLERKSYQVYETTIYAKADQRDVSKKTLSSKEFLNVPGARGDPVKAVENLPGVARNNSFQAQVIIQGSAPEDTRYSIDGNEVPIIFHFGGLSSVVTPEAISSVDYLAAGYGPKFGRALGGQVAVTTRSPAKDRVKGFAFLDTFNAGGLLEAPLTDHSRFLIAGRQSYIGSVLRSVLRDSSQFQFTAAPEFRDLTAVFESEVTDRDSVKVVAAASQDTLEFLFTQPVTTDPSVRGNFRSSTTFYRIIPQLTHRHSARTTSRFQLGLGRDFINVVLGSNFFDLKTYSLGVRYELERQMSPLWKSYWGMDHQFGWADVNLDLPSFFNPGGVANPVSVSTTRRTSVSAAAAQWGFYWKNTLHKETSPWTFSPSLRLEYYSNTNELLTTPRGDLRYQISDSFSVYGASGLYVQPPEPQETDPTVGNPSIKANRGVHLAIGMDQDFRSGSSNGFVLSGGPFYKYLYNLVLPSTNLVLRNGVLTPENFRNDRTGEVIGAQAQLNYRFSQWSGWLSYTLGRSTRSDSGGASYLFEFDQTHILTVLAAVDLPRNWRISARVRYSTGNPYTPITGGIFDTDNDTFLPVRGPFYSQRFDPFFQLDLRIDKKWIYKKWILSLYLDIQNLTNRNNIQNIQYAYDYSSSVGIMGLPIVPTFGLKGEF